MLRKKSRWSGPENMLTLHFYFLGVFVDSLDNLFKTYLTSHTAGDRACVAAIGRLPALHYSIYFISSWIPFWNFENIRGSKRP